MIWFIVLYLLGQMATRLMFQISALARGQVLVFSLKFELLMLFWPLTILYLKVRAWYYTIALLTYRKKDDDE